MAVLMWEKPEPVMSKEERASYQADGEPPGTFISNMSDVDNMRWKAKLVGVRTGYPQVELRRDHAVVVLSLCGYKYKNHDCRWTPENVKRATDRGRDLPNVYMSFNGHSFTLDEFAELQQAIEEGFERLREISMSIE